MCWTETCWTPMEYKRRDFNTFWVSSVYIVCAHCLPDDAWEEWNHTYTQTQTYCMRWGDGRKKNHIHFICDRTKQNWWPTLMCVECLRSALCVDRIDQKSLFFFSHPHAVWWKRWTSKSHTDSLALLNNASIYVLMEQYGSHSVRYKLITTMK